jgi:hypothetical protein
LSFVSLEGAAIADAILSQAGQPNKDGSEKINNAFPFYACRHRFHSKILSISYFNSVTTIRQ